MDNYEKIIKDNLTRLYKKMPDHLEQLPAGTTSERTVNI